MFLAVLIQLHVVEFSLQLVNNLVMFGNGSAVLVVVLDVPKNTGFVLADN